MKHHLLKNGLPPDSKPHLTNRFEIDYNGPSEGFQRHHRQKDDSSSHQVKFMPDAGNPIELFDWRITKISATLVDTFYFNQSGYEVQEWKESLKVGFIIAMVFLTLILLVFTALPNLYWARERCRGKRVPLAPKVEWPYKASRMYKSSDRVLRERQSKRISLDLDELENWDTMAEQWREMNRS